MRIILVVTKKYTTLYEDKFYPARLCGEIDYDSKEYLLWWLPKEQEHLLSVAFPAGTIICTAEVVLP